MMRVICMAMLVLGVHAGLLARGVHEGPGGHSAVHLFSLMGHGHDHHHHHPDDGHDHHDDRPDDHHHHGPCCVNLVMTVEMPAIWRAAVAMPTCRPEWPPAETMPDDPHLASEKPPLIPVRA